MKKDKLLKRIAGIITLLGFGVIVYWASWSVATMKANNGVFATSTLEMIIIGLVFAITIPCFLYLSDDSRKENTKDVKGEYK